MYLKAGFTSRPYYWQPRWILRINHPEGSRAGRVAKSFGQWKNVVFNTCVRLSRHFLRSLVLFVCFRTGYRINIPPIMSHINIEGVWHLTLKLRWASYFQGYVHWIKLWIRTQTTSYSLKWWLGRWRALSWFPAGTGIHELNSHLVLRTTSN